MSDFTKYLKAWLSGDTSAVPPIPDSNIEKIIAKGLGLWDGDYPAPKGDVDALLIMLVESGVGGGGGGELPALTNPATAALILATYEAINKNGTKITGTMPDNGAISEKLDANTPTVNIPKGYHNGEGSVAVELEEKTVTPGTEAVEVTPTAGKVLGKVTVEAAPESGGGEDLVITDASYLFYNGARADSLEEFLALCESVTSCEGMFSGWTLLASLDLSNFDTSNVANMSYMFSGCKGLKSLDLSNFDTSNVADMSYMFHNSNALLSLDLSGWDTGNVTNMECMFYDAGNDNWDLRGLSGWDVSKVTNMKQMFYSCGRQSLDLSGWDTGNVLSFEQMFYSCSKLVTLDLSGWDTKNATTMANMFAGCNSLVSLDLSNFDTSKVTNMLNMLNSCKALTEVIGFSATNKAGISIGFPNGAATAPAALRRLTFRTDLDEGVYAIRSAIKISHACMHRENFLEMANSLSDVSSLGLSSSNTTITLTGNPCVSDELTLTGQSTITEYASYEKLCAAADIRYRGLDYQNAPIQYRLYGETGTTAGTFADITADMWENGSVRVQFLGDTITVPDEVKLTDEDRAIATDKGWTLVE